MCADEPWSVDELYAVVARAVPLRELCRARCSRACSTCSPGATRRTSSPSCGRAWSGTASAGTVRRAATARVVAVTSARHDPRSRAVRRVPGEAARASASSTRRWSTRAAQGETFLLGATHVAHRGHHPRPRDRHAGARRARQDAVLARRRGPAGRSSSGRAIGAFCRELAALGRRARRPQRLRPSTPRRAAPPTTCVAYLAEQADATGVVPTDRAMVVERFRDELGDWRVCVLSPFGGRVHAPWALALGARWPGAPGMEVAGAVDATTASRCACPDGRRRRPTDELLLLDPDEVEDLLVGELARLGAVRRAGSARTPPARCCSRGAGPASARRCGSSACGPPTCWRWPSRYGSFPIVLETYRECLQDDFDLPALRAAAARRPPRARSASSRSRPSAPRRSPAR